MTTEQKSTTKPEAAPKQAPAPRPTGKSVPRVKGDMPPGTYKTR